MKINTIIVSFALVLCGLACKSENKSVSVSNENKAVSVNNENLNRKEKPIFNAVSLVGKNSNEVKKILGKLTDSWTPRTGPSDLMQSYALGEDTTVEFHNNRIKSIVIFFDQKGTDTSTAYQLVGLEYANPKPAGISNITNGEGWIKISY
jgi:hypothetical protein